MLPENLRQAVLEELKNRAAGGGLIGSFPLTGVRVSIISSELGETGSDEVAFRIAANDGFVNVGIDHDTPVFAVISIETWWKHLGQKRYPEARELYITADAGGSNGYRLHGWKAELQRLADKLKLAIHVSHFPPGTSKWNKIEHRLFSFITMNWRGRPLRSYETVVSLIGNTTTVSGLVVRAQLDRRKYPTGVKIAAKDLRALDIERDVFHGDWNYVIRPRNHAS